MKEEAKEEILKWIAPVGLEAKKKQRELTKKK